MKLCSICRKKMRRIGKQEFTGKPPVPILACARCDPNLQRQMEKKA